MGIWDEEAIRRQGVASLARIAGEGRLTRGDTPVRLTRLELSALAVVEAAIERQMSVTLVYPAPNEKAGLLLAAQILICQFVNEKRPEVGLLTDRPYLLSKWWRELAIRSTGLRARLHETFPLWRAQPDGAAPFKGKRFRGLLMGRVARGWPVQIVVDEREYVSGPNLGAATTVRLSVDPLSVQFHDETDGAQPIWAWSPSLLEAWATEINRTPEELVAAHGRASNLSQGRSIVALRTPTLRTQVCRHPNAAHALDRLREDMRVLTSEAGDSPSLHVLQGVKAAWSYTTTISSLPCRPSDHDRFAGLPPRAARPVQSLPRELEAWANTLRGDIGDYAKSIVVDLQDLLAAVEEDNPFSRAIEVLATQDWRAVLVVRSQTAARGLQYALGRDSNASTVGSLELATFRDLRGLPAFDKCIFVGIPPRRVWHQIDSGLAPTSLLLVFGENDQARADRAFRSLLDARSWIAGPDIRQRAWLDLFGAPPVEPPLYAAAAPPVVETETGPSAHGQVDPFSPLGALARGRSLMLDDVDEGIRVARALQDGSWSGTSPAVRVEVHGGWYFFDIGSEIEVRTGDRVRTKRPIDLQPGDHILVGRRDGRLGLIESLEEELRLVRPDLMTAHMLARDYRKELLTAFVKDPGDLADVQRRVRSAGCDKDPVTIRNWFSADGPMGPRDFDDHLILRHILSLPYSDEDLRQIFAGIVTLRIFRRSAGRALAKAATHATVQDSTDGAVHSTLGLSLADLREAIEEFVVVEVTILDEEVPVTTLGRLNVA